MEMEGNPNTDEVTDEVRINMDQINHTNKKDSIIAAPDEFNTCLLFTSIPPELRLQIYEEVFEGSKASYKQVHTIGNRTYHNVLLPTCHYNFLLTCHQAYNEALKTYWSETILYGDPDDRELVFFLRSVVPGFAKLHVKHIRGLESYNISKRPVYECLEDFPKLQTIGFETGFFFDMTPYVQNNELPPTMKEQAEEYFRSDSPWEFSSLVSYNGPAVVCRVVFRRGMIEGPLLTIEERFEKDRKVCFYNYSTGKMLDAGYPSHPDDDEACFAKVLEHQINEGQESGQQA